VIDTGIGLSGYRYELSTGSNFTPTLFSGFTTSTTVQKTGLSDGTYYRRVYSIDIFNNSGSRSTGTFGVNSTTPTANPPIIFQGLSGQNGSTGYYK